MVVTMQDYYEIRQRFNASRLRRGLRACLSPSLYGVFNAYSTKVIISQFELSSAPPTKLLFLEGVRWCSRDLRESHQKNTWV